MNRPIGWHTLVMMVSIVAALGSARAAAPQSAGTQGVWRSGDTSIRIAANGSEVKATFQEVGQAARTLGFKPGDVSLVATAVENYLHGMQTIRYGANCYRNGRKVPMIGRIVLQGQVLAIHHYLIAVDANCRDTGEYTVSETLWQRVPGR